MYEDVPGAHGVDEKPSEAVIKRTSLRAKSSKGFDFPTRFPFVELYTFIYNIIL